MYVCVSELMSPCICNHKRWEVHGLCGFVYHSCFILPRSMLRVRIKLTGCLVTFNCPSCLLLPCSIWTPSTRECEVCVCDYNNVLCMYMYNRYTYGHSIHTVVMFVGGTYWVFTSPYFLSKIALSDDSVYESSILSLPGTSPSL